MGWGSFECVKIVLKGNCGKNMGRPWSKYEKESLFCVSNVVKRVFVDSLWGKIVYLTSSNYFYYNFDRISRSEMWKGEEGGLEEECEFHTRTFSTLRLAPFPAVGTYNYFVRVHCGWQFILQAIDIFLSHFFHYFLPKGVRCVVKKVNSRENGRDMRGRKFSRRCKL